jgi:hypothetical protein
VNNQLGIGGPLLVCSMATVEAYTKLVCLTLKRDTFAEILGPLEQLMAREKSPQIVAQKMAKLQPRGSHVQRPPAEVGPCPAGRRQGYLVGVQSTLQTGDVCR